MIGILIVQTLRINLLDKELKNKKIDKAEIREETKEQIEQKNRKEAFGRLIDYSIEKAYESKVK